jgi:hypothetical protein
MLNQSKKIHPGIPIEDIQKHVKPEVWATTHGHKDYSHVESITFIFGFDDEGEATREVSFQYLRGTFGTRFKENHLAISYDELLKLYLKSKSIQGLDKISELDLFNFYCAHGENKNRNPLSTRLVSMEVDMTGKNTIKLEIGVPKGRTNRVLEVINTKTI